MRADRQTGKHDETVLRTRLKRPVAYVEAVEGVIPSVRHYV